MIQAQNPIINANKFSRCEERMQMADHENKLTPIQKNDSAIKDHIGTALWKDDAIRATEYDEINVHVNSGVVYLNGHIVSAASQNHIENIIRAIPGIEGIINNLILDDKLTLEVAASLVELEHDYDCKFFTGTSHGVVFLGGIVNNEKVILLAERCAANNPNVRGVISNIHSSRTGNGLHTQRFLQPVIGELIYFLDGVSGTVKQVIINPNNRCVIAMVLQGKFTDSQYEKNSLADGRTRIPEQLVIVPVRVVRYLTKVSGFLYILSSERKQYMDFDAGHFFAPDKDWVPPYPYCSSDVLFPINDLNEDLQIVSEPDLFPFGEIIEEASVREQFFATDSFGL
jgi:osmotically-inducible protein OsmY